MNRPVLRLCLLGILFLYWGQFSYSQGDISVCRKAKAIVDRMEEYHFSPVILDDVSSEEIYETTLKALDPDKTYFTQEDLLKLEPFRKTLDEELKRNVCSFPETLIDVYRNALQRADSIVELVTADAFNFDSKESLIIDYEDHGGYTANDQALVERWRKHLKMTALGFLFLSFDESKNPLELKRNQILKDEKEVRGKVERRAKRAISKILKGELPLETQVANTYLLSLTERYDPHSAYFTYDEKARFEQALSTNGEFFGFRLRENRQGQIEIARLMPGGSAWKSNQMNKGDILLACKTASGKKYDLTDLDLDEFEDIIEVPSLKKITLTVRKKDGKIEKVNLTKTKIRNEENLVKSMILDGPNSIGYIKLPGFYTEWENDNGSSCANDMAKEIVKLRQENIEGLIIDLRNNGGGSVTEAMDLAGIFIDRGPLMIERYRDEKPTSIKDKNLGFVWDGPLVVLVNGLSASASEFVAATLQDYNRAVIVGSSTYGKSTSQVISPVDPGFNLDEYKLHTANSEWGYMKMTIGKYNRINGSSHQKIGVQPDIPLPGLFEGLDFKESSQEHALEPDFVDKKMYYTPGSSFPMDELKANSQDRIDNDNRFIQVVMLNDTLKALQNREKKIVPLELEAYRSYAASAQQTQEKWEELSKKTTELYTIRNSKAEETILEMDTFLKENNDFKIDKLSKDFYLEEAYQIICDLIRTDN